MDSKTGIPPSSYEEGLAPPSYDESLSSSRYEPGPSTSYYYSQQIQSQLNRLTTQVSSLKTQKFLLSHAQDRKILSLLTTQIEIYLSAFAKTGLETGTLILVPAKGPEANANPAEFQDEKKGGIPQYDQFVRITDKEGTDDGEGEIWFWRDEDMAIRLAGYLKPAPDLKNAPLPPRKEQVKAAAESSSSRGLWGRKKSVSKPPLIEERRDVKVQPDVLPSEGGRAQEEVLIDVKAEEVVFRTENDFGILETQRGWSIVLRLRVVQKKG